MNLKQLSHTSNVKLKYDKDISMVFVYLTKFALQILLVQPQRLKQIVQLVYGHLFYENVVYFVGN